MGFLIGTLGDNLWIFWESFRLNIGISSDNYYGLFGNNLPRVFSEPSLWLPYFFISKLLSNVLLWNTFIVSMFIINLFISYRFFRVFVDKYISLCLSLIWCFSPFVFYRSEQHLSLSAIFVVPLFLYLVIKLKEFKYSNLLLGFCIALIFTFSNYSGYFLLLLYSLYFIFKALIYKKGNLIKSLIFLLKKLFILYFTFTLSVTILAFKYIYYTYFLSQSVTSVQGVERNLEDFFYFTSRPWYYFLPSPENPWFGGFTTRVINWLQNDWGYWLTYNYFPSEHSASYLGYINFIFAVLGLVYVYKKLKFFKVIKWGSFRLVSLKIKYLYFNRIYEAEVEKNTELKKYLNIFILGLVAIVLIVLTMPPYFTISLHKVYMPSFILWKIFPMFRVLARMGVLILLIELIYTGFGYVYFLKILKSKLLKLKSNQLGSLLIKKWSVTSFFILLPFITLSLMEFYVPITLTDVSTPPAVFTYIKNDTPKNSVIAVYPYGKTGDAVFWLSEYQRNLANPKDYVNLENGFSSSEFTKKLNTCEGLLNAKNSGINYLVYFYGKDGNKDIIAFSEFSGIKKVEQFYETGLEQVGNKYYKIINKSNAQSFSAILFDISDTKCIAGAGGLF